MAADEVRQGQPLCWSVLFEMELNWNTEEFPLSLPAASYFEYMRDCSISSSIKYSKNRKLETYEYWKCENGKFRKKIFIETRIYLASPKRDHNNSRAIAFTYRTPRRSCGVLKEDPGNGKEQWERVNSRTQFARSVDSRKTAEANVYLWNRRRNTRKLPSHFTKSKFKEIYETWK